MITAWDIVQGAGAVIAPPAETQPGAGGVFADVSKKQEKCRWCWAACAQMMLLHLRADVLLSQCQIASRRLGRDCCRDPEPCNKSCPWTEMTGFLASLGIDAVHRAGSMTEQELITEVLKGRPVQLGYEDPIRPPDGHVVLVVGDSKIRGQKALQVADPYEGQRTRLHKDLARDGYGRTWTLTWHTLCLRP